MPEFLLKVSPFLEENMETSPFYPRLSFPDSIALILKTGEFKLDLSFIPIAEA